MSIPDLRKGSVGRKIRAIRELRNIKQETLAGQLGVSQQAISNMEQNDSIEEERLLKVAEALGVSVDDILNFRDDLIFHNQVNDHGTVFNYIENYQNATEKIAELYEQIIKEKDEVIKSKQEIIDIYKKH